MFDIDVDIDIDMDIDISYQVHISLDRYIRMFLFLSFNFETLLRFHPGLRYHRRYEGIPQDARALARVPPAPVLHSR